VVLLSPGSRISTVRQQEAMLNSSNSNSSGKLILNRYHIAGHNPPKYYLSLACLQRAGRSRRGI
jgi:hypothetical protein